MQKKMNLSVSGGTAKAPVRELNGAQEHSPEIDSRILFAFKNSYVYKTFLQSDSVVADAKDGIVTLTGTVSEESHKTLAQETVAHMTGVVRVDNKLETIAEIEAENADTWIGRKIKLNLLFHFHVNASGTTVEVKDRVVTLRGEASSFAQKELTTEYANDIEGVKAIKNEMTVANLPEPAKRTTRTQMDDASIFAQVYGALMTHRSTSTIKTKAEVREGVVSLTGIARNAAEKALVTKIVTDIHGVNSVKNQMTVEEAV